MDNSALEVLLKDPRKKQAWLISLRLLTATAKSRRALFSKLEHKGFSEIEITEVLNLLEQRGLLNDTKFAKGVVNRFTMEKPCGIRKISFELKRKGIAERIRNQVLREMNPADEKAKAMEVAEAKWASWFKLPLDKRKKRVYDLLLRRGFEFETARETIEILSSRANENR